MFGRRTCSRLGSKGKRGASRLRAVTGIALRRLMLTESTAALGEDWGRLVKHAPYYCLMSTGASHAALFDVIGRSLYT
jgi:hypothetical protein